MTGTKCIRNAAWLVAWTAETEAHEYLNNADIAFRGADIVHVGGRYDGPVEQEIDGRRRLVMPGLVNVHSHPMSEPMNKGITDELGSPKLGMSGLYEIMPVFRPDAEGTAACAELAYCELLLSGVTTLVDLSLAWPGWLELFARSGLRGVLAPMYRSARWYATSDHAIAYEWDEAAGRAGLDAALRLIDSARQHPSGRLDGMLSPSQVDTCTEDLLRDSKTASDERGLALQIHASQSIVEFQEMTRRHGITPVQWLNSLGFLGPRSVIAHCIFVDHHDWVNWYTRDDLDLLVATGTHVAHCPTVFARRGILLQHLGRYLKAGVNVGLGTDTFPHNMLEEMRTAAVQARIAAADVTALGLADVLNAATVGGAGILGRDDIGRLAPGAKADLVLVDLEAPAMRPVRDPLRSLVYSAAERAVRDVFVDGEAVVAEGRVLNLDHAGAAARVEAAQRRAESAVPGLDWNGRRHDQVAPFSLPLRTESQ